MYGDPNRNKGMETWHLIKTLASTNSLPWCLIGDINNVCSQNDKKGGSPYPKKLFKVFQDVLEDCNLLDMNLLGHRYTCERGVGIRKEELV